jgi:hypothetical protein
MKKTKKFKKLLGHRVYIEIPEKPDSKLIVDENTKDALAQEMLKKMSRLKVYAVGSLVEGIEEGDEVLVDPKKLPEAYRVPIGDDQYVALVSSFDIIHIW